MLVCGTSTQEPTVAEAVSTKNIAAPVYGFTLDFEEDTVTKGDYTYGEKSWEASRRISA